MAARAESCVTKLFCHIKEAAEGDVEELESNNMGVLARYHIRRPSRYI